MSDDPGLGRGPDRRGVLAGAGACALAALAAQVLRVADAAAQSAEPQAGETFAADHVRKLAQELAARDFAKPRVDLPEPFNALTAEQYRDIRFRPEAAVWRG